MSRGITAYDFVKQVYYAQEKVVLDFHPDDDKFKEVLYEANLVLQELQNVEDWSWLRERYLLGPVYWSPDKIPDFELPEWVYKPSTTFGDCVKLHLMTHHGLSERSFIRVPWASDGQMSARRTYDVAPWDEVQGDGMPLRAFFYGNTVTFNRPLRHFECAHRMAATDVQRRIGLFHICDDNCERDDEGNCPRASEHYLTEIPDPNYVIMQTAARHAAGSPPATSRIADLTDAATRILSAMRSNDVAHTAPDMLDTQDISWIGVF